MEAPRLADPAQATGILALRDAAARWLEGRGIRQWVPGEVSLADVEAQVAAGEWWVVTRGSELLAALRLLWSDEQVWGPQPADTAAYVHGLVVGRARSNPGLGRELLAWAEEQAVAAGRGLLRLDCVETNEVLRGYYEELGFRAVGRKEFESWSPVTLFEKPLGPPPRLTALSLTCADPEAAAEQLRRLGARVLSEGGRVAVDLDGVRLELAPGEPSALLTVAGTEIRLP